ncbi:CLUMA_CG018502, isoform A [Clunio marinus]|uniref:CLUMA_CG018502, isoform A n=1 Tax=Clunio marinus TaxID=568069 RepID=A0A1J1IXZ7_9DIPT|nr:CLUMA_CG018502, isoform A [Clunio marinus]
MAHYNELVRNGMSSTLSDRFSISVTTEVSPIILVHDKNFTTFNARNSPSTSTLRLPRAASTLQ